MFRRHAANRLIVHFHSGDTRVRQRPGKCHDGNALLPELARHLRLGFFGASTGGGAALVAAAERPDLVGAVVSRGGRPDLAGTALAHVTAPTLLIVGGEDDVVVDLNRAALIQMRCEVKLEIILGATHLFEEPGALARVADLAGAWFSRHLSTEARVRN